MAPRVLRRLFLWLFLGFLGITALLAIGAVLSSEFGDTQARVLSSSASISAASVLAMACAAFRERGRVPVFGSLGIVLAGLALLAALVLIWTQSEHPSEAMIKTTLLLVVYAVGTAHAELLLLPPLARRHAVAQPVGVGLIALLAALLTIVILDPEDVAEGLSRSIAVVSILVALVTLAIPILWKLGGEVRGGVAGAAVETLALRRRPDGTWVDAAGAGYRVERIEAGAGDGVSAP
jgi:peptidoglycan/LPS O-acetylase OafA/YrhL